MKIELDVHTHTIASGHAFSTLQEMAQAAADKGLKVLGITEHSPGVPGTCHPIYFRFLSIIFNQLRNKLLANYLRNGSNDLATVRISAFCVAMLSNNSFFCKENIFFESTNCR